MYKLKNTRLADSDIADISNFTQSVGAITYVPNMLKAISALIKNPYIGSDLGYRFPRLKNHRFIKYKKYAVIYEIIENKKIVYIKTIFAMKKDFSRLQLKS